MTDRQNDTKSMALFCDFENVALGVREAKYQDFDINKVLERLLLKGSIVVKKAYCDWGRYREFKATMHQASFELIEIPHVRMSGKNSADIRMVVDALDLCYTKSHVDTFVIISGDSDFSPLVSKLRENAKTVIGVGVKNSTSELLINNCDEFIYYDDLVRVAAARPSRRRTGERSGERSGERTHERGAERTGERTGERGLERLAERGGDRPADRGADRGAERNADRPADRSPDRAADRGADRTRRPQPRRGGIADPAVPASMAAPEDGVVAVAVPSEPVETMLSVSADVIAHLAGDSVADVDPMWMLMRWRLPLILPMPMPIRTSQSHRGQRHAVRAARREPLRRRPSRQRFRPCRCRSTSRQCSRRPTWSALSSMNRRRRRRAGAARARQPRPWTSSRRPRRPKGAMSLRSRSWSLIRVLRWRTRSSCRRRRPHPSHEKRVPGRRAAGSVDAALRQRWCPRRFSPRRRPRKQPTGGVMGRAMGRAMGGATSRVTKGARRHAISSPMIGACRRSNWWLA
jgi:uncharacterized protein (TIGR00288 family)